MYVCVDKEEIDKYVNLDLKIVYKIQCKTTNVINSRFKVPFVSNLKFCVTYITQLCYRPYNTVVLFTVESTEYKEAHETVLCKKTVSF